MDPEKHECECWCAVHLAEVLERVRRALKTLQAAERYDTDDVDPDTWSGDKVAQAVDADVVDQVIQILEGEEDEETD